MRTPRLRMVALASFALAGLLLAACGQGQKVGSEQLLEFEEQQGDQRLGARTPDPKSTPGTLAVDQPPTPKPTAKPTPKPDATPSYFDVTLVADPPYYKPGNRIGIRAGVTLRITNRDTTAERSNGRSFTDKGGTFHSGLLKPGQTWTWTFDSPARYEVIDEGLNFATAILEVTP